MLKLGILAADGHIRSAQNLALLAKHYEVLDYSDWAAWTPEALLERCRAADVLLTARHSPRLPLELLKDRGRLKYVCHLHGTIRHLVDKALIEAGLLVTNWGDNVWRVAEGAMALLLCQLKQIPSLDRAAKGRPDRCIHTAYPPTLRGRDVGLYGYGPIGRHMGDLLAGFGARIAIYDPYAADLPPHVRRCETLRDLFATCQIVSIHCGLNDVTRGSVTRELLELLPQGGLLVNTARGAIVDEEALADLVARRRLLAAIDVIRDESDWPASPLAKTKGTVLTRHKISGGWYRPHGCLREWPLPKHAAQNLEAFAHGRPLKHVVTAEVYDLKT